MAIYPMNSYKQCDRQSFDLNYGVRKEQLKRCLKRIVKIVLYAASANYCV